MRIECSATLLSSRSISVFMMDEEEDLENYYYLPTSTTAKSCVINVSMVGRVIKELDTCWKYPGPKKDCIEFVFDFQPREILLQAVNNPSLAGVY